MIKFLNKKGITLSPREYFITATSYMTFGMFGTLIIGLIVRTFGEQLGFAHLVELGSGAMGLMGAGIGVGVAYGLKAPQFVLFPSVFTGTIGATLGGPVGAFVAALVATEMGKMVSKETKVDILITPLVTVLTGYFIANLVGVPMNRLMIGIGNLITMATNNHPVVMGILVAMLMGLALTAPISSAAIALMLGLDGLAAGAATIGCSAQMIGFAVSSFRENKMGGLIAIGIGTSMLQFPNILKNPKIVIPPLVASGLVAIIGTTILPMTNNPAGAGMGTSGFVGQIMTFTTMGFTMETALKILFLHLLAPAVISLLLSEWLRKIGWIKSGDMKLNLEG